MVLQIDDNTDFRAPLLEIAANGDVLDVRLARPLPPLRSLRWRGVARANGEVTTSAIGGPRVSAPWVRLLSPDAPNGSVLVVRRPTFVWSPARVTNPPGPWQFTIEIVNPLSRRTVTTRGLSDTTFTIGEDLEFSTPYRWTVTAILPATSDTARFASAGSFVIVDEAIPPVTLLYQNFPNPFPTTSTTRTCIWFDLGHESSVSLEVFDLRGNRIRTILPGSGVGPTSLAPGRYGRSSVAPTAGCDPRITWDGTTDDGRVAHPGVYLLRLRADGTEATKKVIFRGR